MTFIRTDANKEIATGHIMRCLTIAEQLDLKGEQVIFLVSDLNSVKLIQDTKYNYICLNCSWKNLDAKQELAALQLSDNQKPNLIIDTYSVKNAYIKEMRKHFNVICFDDMFDEKYDVDVLINYNLYYEKFDYEKRYLSSGTKLLLGGQYVPLRSQFLNQNVNRTWSIDYQKKRILLICGGGDPLNCMARILKWMIFNCAEFFEKIRWDVVVGNYNCYEEQLKDLQEKYHNICLHYNVKNMAKLMSECYLCISAASTVLYECCAMQLPTVFFVQQKIRNMMHHILRRME